MILIENKLTQLFILLFAGISIGGLYFFMLTFLPVADLAKEFGVPAWAAAWILTALDASTTVTAIVSFLTALGTGGLSLIAAAGTMGIKKYLKEELEKRGKQAFIAW
ncbi:uberolysin/carnocyclin family circular bacteriocin [Geobacillus vulcani]|uniref:uberolysin/carnocyclin family circular bacteriocin n=1 Tax=Geobacillus vulcani TaxID=135517 RepID=UPI0004DF74D7|nr:uberolysin/carnocyclin family circular bacteriocin [Geobacillus vulcani]